MILEYIDQRLHQRTFEILTGLSIAAKNNTQNTPLTTKSEEEEEDDNQENRAMDNAADTFDGKLIRRLKQFAETRVLNLSISRALDAGGRSFFFKSKCKALVEHKRTRRGDNDINFCRVFALC